MVEEEKKKEEEEVVVEPPYGLMQPSPEGRFHFLPFVDFVIHLSR